MKTIVTASILYCFVLCSCKQSGEGKNIVSSAATDTIKKNDNHHISKDTMLIVPDSSDTLFYTEKEFNRLADENPALFFDPALTPDEVYSHTSGLTSEAGQDQFYLLYACLLAQKNGLAVNAERRQGLSSIYKDINSLFASFEYGGTYFGHQSFRIQGYAEYGVYLYKASHQYSPAKTYDISKGKELYIGSLRQLINDECSIDGTPAGNPKGKNSGLAELNKIVDHISCRITDLFYLRRAQEFHYSHYEYY